MSGMVKGIDVSEHNGVIDWEQVKASGVSFAILRAGYGQTVDLRFKRNASECARLDLPIGAYWFSYALNAAEAAREAARCLDTVRPYHMTYPISFDLEYDSVKHAQKNGVYIGMDLATEMALAFCRAVRAAGYSAMNYANPDYLRRYYDTRIQAEFPLWLAQWPGEAPDLDNPSRPCFLWQYTANGKVPGISGPVDLDVCYEAAAAREKELARMTGEQIYHALNAYLDTQPVPVWAKDELDEAKTLGITDGSSPMRLIPRYQAAIMAKRALRCEARAQ